jgi:hypothetical protein
MTPTEKRRLWNALFVATRNGYPGATYEAHDKPSDPRVRGGRWNWKQRDLIALYDKMVYYIESGQPVSAKLEILNYKTKFTQASLGKIIQAITFGSPPVPLDVIPNPTPDWANIQYDGVTGLYTPAVQQIQGINTSITLEVSGSTAGLILYTRVDNSIPAWSNGVSGSWIGDITGWTTISSLPYVFNVTNNQYVSFGCDPDSSAPTSRLLTIKNNSDGAIVLDTLTAATVNLIP